MKSTFQTDSSRGQPEDAGSLDGQPRPDAALASPPASRTGFSSTLHVAIIMDGNGRWAAARGLPRTAGHRRGAEAVRRVVEAAPRLGIGTLTLFAFSSDNWKRPLGEVGALMRLFRASLISEQEHLVTHGVRLSVIGRRDRLPRALAIAIARAERATRDGRALHLRVAVDYSARDAIVEAARGLHAELDGKRRSSRADPPAGPSRRPGPGVLTRATFAQRLGR